MPKAFGELAHLAIPVASMPMLAWVSAEECRPELIEPIKNIHSVKPMGGLWLSPFLGYTAGTEWTYFLETEASCLIREDGQYKLQHVRLAPDARVLCIDTWDHFAQALSAYLLLHPDHDSVDFWRERQHLDFERMSNDWDAIYLTDEGQWATRYGEDGKYSLRSSNLYGWDLASVLVLNPDAIEDFGEPELFKLVPEPDWWEDLEDCEA